MVIRRSGLTVKVIVDDFLRWGSAIPFMVLRHALQEIE